MYLEFQIQITIQNRTPLYTVDNMEQHIHFIKYIFFLNYIVQCIDPSVFSKIGMYIRSVSFCSKRVSGTHSSLSTQATHSADAR